MYSVQRRTTDSAWDCHWSLGSRAYRRGLAEGTQIPHRHPDVLAPRTTTYTPTLPLTHTGLCYSDGWTALLLLSPTTPKHRSALNIHVPQHAARRADYADRLRRVLGYGSKRAHTLTPSHSRPSLFARRLLSQHYESRANGRRNVAGRE